MLLNTEGNKPITYLTKTYFMQRYTVALSLHFYRANAFPPITI